MSTCLSALRLDIDSITRGSVVECLNDASPHARCITRKLACKHIYARCGMESRRLRKKHLAFLDSRNVINSVS